MGNPPKNYLFSFDSSYNRITQTGSGITSTQTPNTANSTLFYTGIVENSYYSTKLEYIDVSFGSALKLNYGTGTNGNVFFNNSANNSALTGINLSNKIMFSKKMTVAFWLLKKGGPGSGGSYSLLDFTSSGNISSTYSITVSSNGNLNVGGSAATTNFNNVRFHFAVTFNTTTTTTTNIRVYVNGSLNTTYGNKTVSPTAGENSFFGSYIPVYKIFNYRPNGSGELYYLDEFRHYAFAADADEINKIYRS
jgi:hypothetical protein